MISVITVWLTHQLPLAGPFVYAVEREWIPNDVVEHIVNVFFAPLVWAAEYDEFAELLMKIIEVWQP